MNSRDMTNSKNRPRAIWLALLACAALPGVSAPQAAEPAPGAWVNGITEAINDVVLSAPSAGIISRRAVKEGDFVKAGETIVELDRKLEEIEAGRRKFVLDLKKSDMENSQKIFEKSISISREEMEKKIAEYSVANAEHALAQEQLQRRFLIAPFDGTVAALTLEVGEACQAQQPLARLVDTRRCYFVANIEARSGHALRPGQSVKLEIEAGNTSASVTGTVFFVSPVVDPASGLMRVKVVVENPDGQIRPGVAGRMLLQENKDA